MIEKLFDIILEIGNLLLEIGNLLLEIGILPLEIGILHLDEICFREILEQAIVDDFPSFRLLT